MTVKKTTKTPKGKIKTVKKKVVKEPKVEVVETAESKEETKAEKFLTIVIRIFLILFVAWLFGIVPWCERVIYYKIIPVWGVDTSGDNPVCKMVGDLFPLTVLFVFSLMLVSLFFAFISRKKKNPRIRAKYWLRASFVFFAVFLSVFCALVKIISIRPRPMWGVLRSLFLLLLGHLAVFFLIFILLFFINLLKRMSKEKRIWVVFVIVVILLSAILSSLSERRREYEGSVKIEYGTSSEVWDISFEKPIIYLYPEQTTDVTVTLGKPENLTHTYPKYENKWQVVAQPNGDLTDSNGRHYYALYWEGKNLNELQAKDGFIVKGVDTIPFLEEKLALLGLTEREANEFIVYWLPELESNEYNFIRFETAKEIEANMPLTVNPEPGTIIRVMMEFRRAKETEQVEEQKLPPQPERKGFVVVEWGGTRLK